MKEIEVYTQSSTNKINKTQNIGTRKCKYYYHFLIKLSKHNTKRRRSGSLLIVTFLDACLVQQWWGAARAAGASLWPRQHQAQELTHAQRIQDKRRDSGQCTNRNTKCSENALN